MAEREGFEPSEELSPLTRLAGERLQPTRPSLQLQLNGGGSRIRTHGAVTLNGFQDRRFQPLSHPSVLIPKSFNLGTINYHLENYRSMLLLISAGYTNIL